MTTPDDTTPTAETTNRQTDRTTTDRTTSGPTATDRALTADPSPRSIPGRLPTTEEAGAPIVPRTRTTTRTTEPMATDSRRRPSPPPTEAERDAPLVPDLRPTRRRATDGGSR